MADARKVRARAEASDALFSIMSDRGDFYRKRSFGQLGPDRSSESSLKV